MHLKLAFAGALYVRYVFIRCELVPPCDIAIEMLSTHRERVHNPQCIQCSQLDLVLPCVRMWCHLSLMNSLLTPMPRGPGAAICPQWPMGSLGYRGGSKQILKLSRQSIEIINGPLGHRVRSVHISEFPQTNYLSAISFCGRIT